MEQCLCAVVNASKNIETEIIVIDNNSTDGSKEFFSSRFPQVQFIWNEENVGFSKANNTALKMAKGKFILFLNPDTIIAADCLETCLAFFKSKKDIGALGTRMINGSGRYLKESKRGFPSPLTSIFKICGLTALFPHSKIFASYYLGQLNENKNQIIDVLAGAFMLIDKRVLEITKGFDESFFMYGEDIDLSYRIQKAGYKNYYFAENTIIHFKGESTKKGNLPYNKLFFGAMELFVKKHYPASEAVIYSLLIRALIWFKTINVFFTQIFSFTSTSNKAAIKKSIPTVIVAGENDYASILKVLPDANIRWQIIGRVGIGTNLHDNSLGQLKQLAALVKQHKIKKVIFCINELTAKEIIAILQTIKLPVSYSFHSNGSSSIVSSSDQNSTGNPSHAIFDQPKFN